jgi:hypothetical protein
MTVGANNRARRKAKEKARRRDAREAFSYILHRQPDSFETQTELKIAGAVLDLASGDQAGFEIIVDQLTTGPGGAEGRAIVDRVLFGTASRVVGALWQGGWQPAELHRQVRRRASAAQAGAVTDIMAALMRGFAAATVDERWEAQLRDLDAAVWWERDDGYVDALARRARADRSDAVRTLLELIATLQPIPPIPELMPPPGEARRGALAGTVRREVDRRVLERVRGLLAKAESTTFEAEAETYTAKAQELMARHSIDYALLAAERGGRDDPLGRRLPIDSPYEAEKVTLVNAVAQANRAKAVWSQALGFVTVFGFPADLDAIELLFTSLLVQATRAMTAAGQRHSAGGRARSRSFRQSFLTGFAHRIGERLHQATEAATAEAAASTGRDLLPVLASREEQVDEALEAMFPTVVMKTRSRVNDAHGYHSGVAAADRASLQVHESLPR